MDQNRPLSFTLRVIIAIGGLYLVVMLLSQGAALINSLLLGCIIVVSASPLLHWLRARGLPGWAAFSITLFTLLIVLGILLLLVGLAVASLVEVLPQYLSQLEAALEGLQDAIEDLLSSFGINAAEALNFLFNVDVGAIAGAFVDFLGGTLNVLSSVVLVGMIVIFLLVDALNMPKKLAAEIGAGNDYLVRLAAFGGDIRRYVYITTIVGLVTGVLDTGLFLVFGVDFAVIWGILAFIFSYIPTIGFWIAAVPPTLLAWLESGPLVGLVVFLGIILINGFAENVVKPRSMGKGLDISPFVVIFSVILWSAILGPMGAILAIPLTLVVKKLVLEVDDQNRWIARMMAAEVSPVDEPERKPVAEPDERQASKQSPSGTG